MAETAKIVCDLDGYEHVWVEIDVSDWGYAEYLDIMTTAQPLITIKYFEPYSINWHVTADSGAAIPHPGRHASRQVWTTVYKQLGIKTSRALGGWLPLACLLAAVEAQQLSPKSAGDDSGDSDGAEGTA